MPDGRTMMSLLSERGYRTHGVGKMHFTPDPAASRGFGSRDTQEEFGDCHSDDYLGWLDLNGHGHVEYPHGLRDEMYYIPQLSLLTEAAHPTTWVADRSIEFLGRQRDPFFLWSGFIAPHPPFSPPTPWHRRYPPSLLPDPHRPSTGDGLLTAYNRLQNRYKFRDGGRDRRLEQLIRSYYFASVSFADAQIGRMMAALEASGRADRTLIILAADHGEFLGDYGCYGKRSFLDVAARIPMICSGPGFSAGRTVGSPVSLLDVLPTVLTAAGVALPAIDGSPLQEPGAGRILFGQYQQGELGLYGTITDRWKYIWSAPDRREFLIDRRHDPRETLNFAYNTRCRELLLDLRAATVEHFDDLDGGVIEKQSGNQPVLIGASPEDGGLAGLAAVERDPDAATLIVQD